MSTMVREFYEAFLEAGASKEKASRAAEVASTFVREGDGTLATKDDIHEVKQEIQSTREDIRVLDTKFNMFQWMMGGLGFGIILLIVQAFVR